LERSPNETLTADDEDVLSPDVSLPEELFDSRPLPDWRVEPAAVAAGGSCFFRVAREVLRSMQTLSCFSMRSGANVRWQNWQCCNAEGCWLTGTRVDDTGGGKRLLGEAPRTAASGEGFRRG
jgi:hypothetical protein